MYPGPTDFGPYGIAASPDGTIWITVSRSGLVWFSEKARDAVVVLDPTTGERVSYPFEPNATVR